MNINRKFEVSSPSEKATFSNTDTFLAKSQKFTPSLLVGIALFLGAQSASAQRAVLLTKFTGGTTDGISPYAGVIRDSRGNLYGTTRNGGTHNAGTVFQLSHLGGSWTKTILYSFAAGADGASPIAGLVKDSRGNLYGTTYYGGSGVFGTVFELSKGPTTPWKHTVIHNFTSSATDGAYPGYGALIIDKNSNLYGTTTGGGSHNGQGTVFKLSPSQGGTWAQTLLYSFAGAPTDGGGPNCSLIMDSKRNLYGTTTAGGKGAGTAFELSPVVGGTYKKTRLYAFAGAPLDGGSPYGGLVMDSSSNLYGTTYIGGNNGYGTVFKLSPLGSRSWTEQVIHYFSFSYTPPEGRSPVAGLVMDSSGNLYGTTSVGGSIGPGTVFKLSLSGTTWNETILHSFVGGPTDGDRPYGGVILDRNGRLYGATIAGGGSNPGGGTVFEVIP